MAGAIVWVHFYLPETKGASLEEMDRVFDSHAGERDAELLREAQQEVSLLAQPGTTMVWMEKGEKGHLEQVA